MVQGLSEVFLTRSFMFRCPAAPPPVLSVEPESMAAVHCPVVATKVLGDGVALLCGLLDGLPDGLPDGLAAGVLDVELGLEGPAAGSGWLHPARAVAAARDKAPKVIRVRVRCDIEKAIRTHSRQSLPQSTTTKGEWPIGAGL